MLRLNIPAQGQAVPPEEKERAPLGRPTTERANVLAANVIDVASQLMLQHGYDGTSLDLIAANAGVTKRTIYAKFGSKEKLLEQVLLQATMTVTQAFPATQKPADLHERLCDLGNHILTTLVEPEMVSWLRFISNEISRRPDLVIYVHPLIDQHNRLIQDVLEALIRDGLWQSDDPGSAAYFFSALITEPAKRHVFLRCPWALKNNSSPTLTVPSDCSLQEHAHDRALPVRQSYLSEPRRLRHSGVPHLTCAQATSWPASESRPDNHSLFRNIINL